MGEYPTEEYVECSRSHPDAEKLEAPCTTCRGSGGGEGYWSCPGCGGKGFHVKYVRPVRDEGWMGRLEDPL